MQPLKDNNASTWNELIKYAIAALIGAAISFCSTALWEHVEDKAAQEALARAFYIDVSYHLISLYTVLDQKSLKSLKEGEKTLSIDAIKINTDIFDSYVRELHSLPTIQFEGLLSFYMGLKYCRDTFGILSLKDPVKVRFEDWFVWVTYLYQNIYFSISNGKKVMELLQDEYGITPDQNKIRTISELEGGVIEKHPKLREILNSKE